VEDYQKVSITDASQGIKKAAENYLNNVDLKLDTTLNVSKEIEVSKITNAVIDGTTYYYIIDKEDNKYKASIKINRELLPFVEQNQKIRIKYNIEKEVTEIIEIEFIA